MVLRFCGCGARLVVVWVLSLLLGLICCNYVLIVLAECNFEFTGVVLGFDFGVVAVWFGVFHSTAGLLFR